MKIIVRSILVGSEAVEVCSSTALFSENCTAYILLEYLSIKGVGLIVFCIQVFIQVFYIKI